MPSALSGRFVAQASLKQVALKAAVLAALAAAPPGSGFTSRFAIDSDPASLKPRHRQLFLPIGLN